MKMKKIAAASLAVCVCALSGMSALADSKVSVLTTTGYDYNAGNNELFTVTSKVSGVAEGKQITYLVWDGSKESSIAYIDQAKATSGATTFTFKATKAKLYPADAVISAKFGTDDSASATDVQDAGFELNEGVNFLTNGTATVSKVAETYVSDATVKGVIGKAFYAKVSGKTEEYGFAVADSSAYKLYQAAGSNDDGTYCVVITGLPEDVTPVPYVKDMTTGTYTFLNN